MPRRCSSSPMRLRTLLGLVVAVLIAAAPSAALAQFSLANADPAAIRAEVVDLLAHEPTLPLPIKQRRAVLTRFYGDAKGDLLWLTSGRARTLLLRISTATADGPSLKPGAKDSRVPALRARLAVTDGIDAKAPQQADNVYDAALVEAVKRFQARHGLGVDGIAGAATLVAMNVPVEERIDQIVMA